MKGWKMCAAVGCENRSVNHKRLHFYKFPQDKTLREIWLTFSRRGSDFEIKKHTVLCQEHFDPSCYVYKQKQMWLEQGSIPTIFVRDTPEGREKVVLTFDRDVLHYVEEDTLLNPAYDKGKREAELVAKREQKLNDIKKLCRFCFEEYEENNLISIAKLKDYGVSPNEMLTLVGINTEHNNIFSKNSCEECFQQIITIDGYRRRCQKVQNALISDLKELDENIRKLRDNNEPSSWFKSEKTWDGNESDDDDHDDDDAENSPNATLTTPGPSSAKAAEQCFQQIIIKEEKEDSEDGMSDDTFKIPSLSSMCNNDDSDDDMPLLVISKLEAKLEVQDSEIDDDEDVDYTDKKKKAKKAPKSPKTKKTPTKKTNQKDKKLKTPKGKAKSDKKEEAVEDVDASRSVKIEGGTETPKAPKYPPRSSRPNSQRTYECFFCHNKYDGKAAYKAHNCQVKNLVCEAPGCMKTFTKLSGFNIHIKSIHKLPRITRFFCKICKLSSVSNEEDFKEHSRRCDKDVDKQITDSPVTCEVCGKFFPTNKSYAVHMMFHKVSEEQFKKPAVKKKYKDKFPCSSFMCELCGREFGTPRYLKDHISRVHSEIDKTKQTFTCDYCGKVSYTRRAVNKHIKNVHTVNPVACEVCGKVFRNKTLLQAHMLYHKDYKRIHFCTLCPEKPPYWTGVALRRHQESSHGFGSGYQCDVCSTNHRTNALLSQHKKYAHGILVRPQPLMRTDVHQYLGTPKCYM